MSRIFKASMSIATLSIAALASSLFLGINTIYAGLKFRTVPVKDKPLVVMAVGGSAADGWGDTKGDGGYLKRAFNSLSKDKGADYDFINKSVAGCGPVQYVGALTTDQQKYEPQMLVISFGLLDDISKKTPMGEFEGDLHAEIAQALKLNEPVVLVTPPVSAVSYTAQKTAELKYKDAEMKVAKAFHSPNIYIVDLLMQEEQYLSRTNQSYTRYIRDNWHPNSNGHELAGQLLAKDLDTLF